MTNEQLGGDLEPKSPQELEIVNRIVDALNFVDEKRVLRSNVDCLVNALPEQLQIPTLDFMSKLAETMVAQLTRDRRDRGDTISVEASPQQVAFYKQRFDEILDSGLLNPHLNPPKKISE